MLTPPAPSASAPPATRGLVRAGGDEAHGGAVPEGSPDPPPLPPDRAGSASRSLPECPAETAPRAPAPPGRRPSELPAQQTLPGSCARTQVTTHRTGLRDAEPGPLQATAVRRRRLGSGAAAAGWRRSREPAGWAARPRSRTEHEAGTGHSCALIAARPPAGPLAPRCWLPRTRPPSHRLPPREDLARREGRLSGAAARPTTPSGAVGRKGPRVANARVNGRQCRRPERQGTLGAASAAQVKSANSFEHGRPRYGMGSCSLHRGRPCGERPTGRPALRQSSASLLRSLCPQGREHSGVFCEASTTPIPNPGEDVRRRDREGKSQARVSTEGAPDPEARGAETATRPGRARPRDAGSAQHPKSERKSPWLQTKGKTERVFSIAEENAFASIRHFSRLKKKQQSEKQKNTYSV